MALSEKPAPLISHSIEVIYAEQADRKERASVQEAPLLPDMSRIAWPS
jgi:hypothetical protein